MLFNEGTLKVGDSHVKEVCGVIKSQNRGTLSTSGDVTLAVVTASAGIVF